MEIAAVAVGLGVQSLSDLRGVPRVTDLQKGNTSVSYYIEGFHQSTPGVAPNIRYSAMEPQASRGDLRGMEVDYGAHVDGTSNN